jgi:hypothetical protein
VTCDRCVVFSRYPQNKTDRHDITEILLKVAINTINITQTLNILFIVFNATFSNISAISWRPVLMVEEAGVLGENHRP